ncbi:hypothetical protein N0M98_11245 [Paenibacillus doosanensis]|uniref:Uncharacterized protein n=1 Tax=Paenibacillus konkukensis TaxID=2020716 RepID=A0ABY4RW40_9BACL|nr:MULTISPECIES: hypothetical protein [Paenibacillus]MCS7460719.1 hypothetical protein [Paenibacillus doosanensis]UQZ85901.1 hypothetical protein SK3146_05191 [Paenibacillus konkukensis]
MVLRKASAAVGGIASLTAMVLWYMLHYANPYSGDAQPDAVWITFFMLFAPAVIALVGVTIKQPVLLAAAFVWSAPVSLYLLMTPGIFAVYGPISFAYLASALMMRRGAASSR